MNGQNLMVAIFLEELIEYNFKTIRQNSVKNVCNKLKGFMKSLSKKAAAAARRVDIEMFLSES